MEKFTLRTDMAAEKRESFKKTNEKQQKNGVLVKNFERLGKKKEKVITVDFPFPHQEKTGREIEETIALVLKELIPEKAEKIIVAGIGNHSITADSVGPKSAENIISSRGVQGIERQVSVIRPEVEAKTGIKTSEYIKAIATKIKPDGIILIDSLASRSIERLFKTIQITNTGIAPGSGLGLRNEKIKEEELGVPVVAIGVPTVVDIKTLYFELTGKEIQKQMVVTPTNADYFVEVISQHIANGVNLFNFGRL